jgi:hypothetical protein
MFGIMHALLGLLLEIANLHEIYFNWKFSKWQVVVNILLYAHWKLRHGVLSNDEVQHA